MLVAVAALLTAAVCSYGQADALIKQGSNALEQNHFHEAAEAFQKAIDLNPSSAKAHELLGVTLLRQIVAGNLSPSADSDVAERAESHLKQAIDLAPSSAKPLMELSELETALAQRSADSSDRSDRYQSAHDLLKRVLDLEPGKANVYLQLAILDRDQFGPAIQQAKAQFSANAGPLPDAKLRHELQQQYGSLIHDAIANARKASELDANFSKPVLLMSRMLQERALLRDTQEQYSSDMHAADDWQRQFLAIGGHIDSSEPHLY